MIQHFISRPHQSRLIMIFLGWAMDFRPFESLRAEGYDIMLLWDYCCDTFDRSTLEGYDEIVVMAWSFGVPAAAKFISENTGLPITSRIAFNGTQHPVDDALGIPQAVFSATLDNLSADSLPKFYRRVAGSGTTFRDFMSRAPQRDIESLRKELTTIAERTDTVIHWDIAYIGKNDLIIPPANQLKAWRNEAARTVVTDSSHLPDFSEIIRQILTDKSLVAERFGRAMSSYDRNAEVQHTVARRLVEMWNPAAEEHPDIIEIGCGTGFSTRLYLKKISPRSLQLWDLVLSPDLPAEAEKVACDAEARLFVTPADSADVIFSSSTVQWFNSLPAFFRNVARVLRKGGRLVMSTFGPDNFRELHSILGTGSGYLSALEIASLLPDTLKVTASREEIITMSFPDTATLLRHISLTGVNALNRTTSPAATRSLLRDYPRSADGSAALTYHPIYLIITRI